VRGGHGGHSPTRVSLASFSLHRAKRMKSRQRNMHHNESNKTDFPRKNNFVNFCVMHAFFNCLNKTRRNWNALRPRGPFLFRSAGKGSKRGRFTRHFGSGKKFSHEPSRSANLPKLNASRRCKHMERFVFCAEAQKIPSRATQSDSGSATLASIELFRA